MEPLSAFPGRARSHSHIDRRNAHAAPSFGPSDTVGEWLQRTVRNAELPGLRDLKASALDAMTTLDGEILNTDLAAELSRKLEKGRQLFTRVGMTASFASAISVEEAGFPPILFAPDFSILADGQEEVCRTGQPVTDWLARRTRHCLGHG